VGDEESLGGPAVVELLCQREEHTHLAQLNGWPSSCGVVFAHAGLKRVGRGTRSRAA